MRNGEVRLRPGLLTSSQALSHFTHCEQKLLEKTPSSCPLSLNEEGIPGVFIPSENTRETEQNKSPVLSDCGGDTSQFPLPLRSSLPPVSPPQPFFTNASVFSVKWHSPPSLILPSKRREFAQPPPRFGFSFLGMESGSTSLSYRANSNSIGHRNNQMSFLSPFYRQRKGVELDNNQQQTGNGWGEDLNPESLPLGSVL